MDNLQLILVAALVYYFLLREDKEGFVALTQAEKEQIRNFSGEGSLKQSDNSLWFKLGTNENREKAVIALPMLELLKFLNVIIDTSPIPDRERVEKMKNELAKQGVNIIKLRDTVSDCIIELIEADNKSLTDVIISSSFSNKINSVFLELNKIDIIVLSGIFVPKDEFCKQLSSSKEHTEKMTKVMDGFNQILSAYSNLIMVFYMFIVKNMNSVITYCGEENTTHLKEFKKMFETIRLAVITKEDLDNKCPRPVPEQVCASYISEASTCNTNLSSLKGQRTMLIVLVVLLLIVLGYKFIA